MKNFSILLIKLLTTAGILLLISTTTSYIEGRPTTRHFYDKRKALRSSGKHKKIYIFKEYKLLYIRSMLLQHKWQVIKIQYLLNNTQTQTKNEIDLLSP